MASRYMCIMNYACYKGDLQDAKHMVTYIICFTFATRTPLDIRSAYSADCGLRPNRGQDALAGSSCSRRKPPPRGTEKSHQWVDSNARMRGPSVMDALSTTWKKGEDRTERLFLCWSDPVRQAVHQQEQFACR